MSWHYRPGRKKLSNGDYYYFVIEWYRPDKHSGTGWSDKMSPQGDSKQELIEDLEMMLADVKKHKTFTLEADTEVSDLESLDLKPILTHTKSANKSAPKSTNDKIGGA